MNTSRGIAYLVFAIVEYMSIGALLGAIYKRDVEAACLCAVTAVYAAVKRLEPIT